MANHKVLGISDRQSIYKSNSGGIRFKMRTTGFSPELTLIANCDPNICLYKLTFGQETKIYNMGDKQEETFPSIFLSNFNAFREYYLTWHNNKIRVGLVGHGAFVNYERICTDPIIGYILFKTECRYSHPVEWIIETSPVILKPLSSKKFSERLHWLPMINGRLPPDAMIGGFENEPIYIARAEHNNSLCPGKFVPSTGRAFVPWGSREHSKQEFEILCGFNAAWVKTRTNYIPQNAVIGGRSEVHNEPLYIGRAMIEGRLLCGKVHVLYKTCYLPFEGKEVEVSLYEILVIPAGQLRNDRPNRFRPLKLTVSIFWRLSNCVTAIWRSD